MKVKHVNVPASATSSINLANHTNNRGTNGPTPDAAGQKIDPVVKLPYRQVEIDGTKCAPNWSPEDVDNNADLGRAANRSWEDTQAQLNPYGDPTHGKKSRVNFDLPKERTARVSFANGVKTVSYSDHDAGTLPAGSLAQSQMPGSALTGSTRRKVVGGNTAKSPVASLKPFGGAKLKPAGDFTETDE